MAGVDAYVAGRVNDAVASKLRDKDLATVEVTLAAEEMLKKRLSWYGSLLGILIALGGLFGFKTLKDAVDAYVRSVTAQIQPRLDAVGKQLDSAQTTLNTIQRTFPATKQAVDQLATQAAQQKERLDSQSSGVNQKIRQFEQGVADATAKTSTLSAEVQKSQQQLNSLVQQTNQRFSTLQTSIDESRISEVYPFLGRATQYEIGPTVLPPPSSKKPGEFWVDVELSSNANAKSVVNTKDLSEVMRGLRDAGYRVFLGTPIRISALGGPMWAMSQKFLNSGGDNSTVFYHDLQNSDRARQIAENAKRYIKALMPTSFIKNDEPPSSPGDAIPDIREHSGIDFQVYIGSDASPVTK
jgi:hypothetical protein